MRTKPGLPKALLIPGAWMGAWIWEDTVKKLNERGIDATTMTLSGLESTRTTGEVTAVRLDDHVKQIRTMVSEIAPRPVILIAHSYSGVVAGQVADRLPQAVLRSIHIGTFLPREGRSLLDDWGPDPEARQAERDQILQNQMLWNPPTRDDLGHEPDLTSEQRDWLASLFAAHPGRTVLDAASMSRPITDQSVTFIATAAGDANPHEQLPPELEDGVPPRWQLRTMHGGHWPMLTETPTLLDFITEAIASVNDI